MLGVKEDIVLHQVYSPVRDLNDSSLTLDLYLLEVLTTFQILGGLILNMYLNMLGIP